LLPQVNIRVCRGVDAFTQRKRGDCIRPGALHPGASAAAWDDRPYRDVWRALQPSLRWRQPVIGGLRTSSRLGWRWAPRLSGAVFSKKAAEMGWIYLSSSRDKPKGVWLGWRRVILTLGRTEPFG